MLSKFDPLWIAAAPTVGALVIWAVVDLQRFVLFAVLGAMILPVALARPGGAQVALADVLLLVALGAWLVTGSARGVAAPWLSGNRLLAPAMLFVAIGVASLAWSIRPRDTIVFSIQLIEIVIVLPLVFASLPRSLNEVRRAMLVLIGLTSTLAVIMMVNYLPNAFAGQLQARSLPLGLNKNTVGSFVAAGLVLAYALWLVERGARARRLLALAIVIEAAGLLSCVSRGSLIGGCVAIVATSLLLRRRRLLSVGIAGIAITVFLAVFGPSSGVDLTVPGSFESSEIRALSFESAIDKIGDRPILGTGAGTYVDYLPELDFIVPDPQNMLLLTWAEVGIFGLLALVALLWRYAAQWVAARELPEGAAVLGVAAGAVTLSLLVHFQVDVTWTRGTTSLAFAMMGLMLAVRRLAIVPVVARTTLANPLRAVGRARASAEFA